MSSTSTGGFPSIERLVPTSREAQRCAFAFMRCLLCCDLQEVFGGLKPCLKLMCKRLGKVMRRSNADVSLHCFAPRMLAAPLGFLYDLLLMLMNDSDHTL